MNLIGMLCNTKETIWPLIKNKFQLLFVLFMVRIHPKKVLHNAKEGFLIQGRAINAQEVVKNPELF
jgi:hypothetical protein